MKTLTMYHPNAIQNIFGDFDHCLESFLGDSLLTSAKRVVNTLPAVDIRETDKAYIVEMELPGYNEKNISVNIDRNHLSISSIQSETEKEKTPADEGAFIIRERKFNAFNRSFRLPDNTDPEAVDASFKNGLLILEIGKRAEAQKRAIRINAA